jgi:acyl-CoA reductase-like NAD-dependent aldehyde dehydrogenase
MFSRNPPLAVDREHDVPHFYLWLHGEARKGLATHLDIHNPFDGSKVATVALAGKKHIDEALKSAEEAFALLRAMPRHTRAEHLHQVVVRLKEAKTELIDTLILEGGKPKAAAKQEVERSIDTFTWAAEEARRFTGEIIAMDGLARGEGYEGYTRREAAGTVLGITPFNFPLNLVAHKVAPALAVGNPVIIKPASRTPISALLLARIVSDAGWPAGTLNVLPMQHDRVQELLDDERIVMLSFTGSAAVGWQLKQRARHQHVVLELGGNAGAYVDASADIAFAAERLALGGFGQAGQSCIAVQRIYVKRSCYDDFLAKLVSAASDTKSGNPQASDTVTGPLISMHDVERVLAWIEEAVDEGAHIACGGSCLDLGQGQLIEPTVLTNVREEMKVCRQEIFGPVVTVTPVADIEEAIRHINHSDYGLQAAVFSRDIAVIEQAVAELQVGGVVINDFSNYRIDPMPYGGIKGSGLGKEGIRSAMLEMSNEKMVVIRKSWPGQG